MRASALKGDALKKAHEEYLNTMDLWTPMVDTFFKEHDPILQMNIRRFIESPDFFVLWADFAGLFFDDDGTFLGWL